MESAVGTSALMRKQMRQRWSEHTVTERSIACASWFVQRSSRMWIGHAWALCAEITDLIDHRYAKAILRELENGNGTGVRTVYKETSSIRRIGYSEHNSQIFSKQIVFTRTLIELLLNSNFHTITYLLTNNVVLTIHHHAASSSTPHHVGSDNAVATHGYALTQSSSMYLSLTP